MKLILSSRGIENKNVKEAFVKILPEKRKLRAIIITTASVDFKERNKYAVQTKLDFEDLNIETSFLDLEFDDISPISEVDIIYINGGNPYYLLHHIYNSKADVLLKEAAQENAIIIGISAGALVLTKTIDIIDLFTPEMNSVNLKDKEALGLIIDVMLPHYDRYISEGKIDSKLVLQYEKENDLEVLKINDHAAFVIDGILKFSI